MTDTAVIVPAMRYSNVERFMTSLRASGATATAYAVADPSETDAIHAWGVVGATVIVGEGTTFAQRINTGYKATDEPWLFVTGDDVLFHKNWLINAQLIASRTAHVVGTNDLTNPRVLAGEHATHMLIRRTYADEVGASWDGPGNVCHEGYRHWFVDDEIVTAAKLRGVWAMALSSRVEHFHPMFGKAKDDEVYRIGQAHVDADRELFERRLAEYAS